MRPTLLLALVVPVLGLPLACGGGAADTGGASATVAAGATAGTAGPDTPATPAPTDPGPTTTTTTTLGANNELQGAKLTTTTTVASTTGSSAPPPKGAHNHEPGRSQADLHAIMTAHRDEARACYDAALPTHPGIQGDLVIQFTIDPKGAVTRVSQDTGRSQINEPGVVACVVNVIKKIQFAASPGGYETMASFPYNFTPRKAQTSPP